MELKRQKARLCGEYDWSDYLLPFTQNVSGFKVEIIKSFELIMFLN